MFCPLPWRILPSPRKKSADAHVWEVFFEILFLQFFPFQFFNWIVKKMLPALHLEAKSELTRLVKFVSKDFLRKKNWISFSKDFFFFYCSCSHMNQYWFRRIWGFGYQQNILRHFKSKIIALLKLNFNSKESVNRSHVFYL